MFKCGGEKAKKERWKKAKERQIVEYIMMREKEKKRGKIM